jgi:predicted TIM-barrel enzyme
VACTTVWARSMAVVSVRGPTSTAIERAHTVVQATHTARQSTLLIRLGGPVADPAWETADIGLEELVLGYMGQDTVPDRGHLTSVGEDQ